MLRHKNTTIISELKNFFTSSEKAVSSIANLLGTLNLTFTRQLDKTDKVNTKYKAVDKFMLLLLFPFFNVKDSSAFKGSILRKLFGGGKDVFYRMLNNPDIAWRKLLYKVNLKLLGKVEGSSTRAKTERCLIVDDTDLQKKGRRIELIGKAVKFDYLLVDSWFTNFELIEFIVTRKIKCHLLGMVKMGNGTGC